jgi:dethiobiotin synthetase
VTFPPLTLTRPGLFITGTGTDIGKTVITCGIASILKDAGVRVGVCKPIATDCRREREGLVNEDAEALAHFADCREPLDIINPVRYAEPLAPAVAAERAQNPVDYQAIATSLVRIEASCDVVLVEGVGGWAVPLNDKHTVQDLAAWIDFPALVVTDGQLGTLNHTAMTCSLIRAAGVRLAGITLNNFDPDTVDLAMQTNPAWIARQNRTSILGSVPRASGVAPAQARLPEEIVSALSTVDWQKICRQPRST